MGSLLFAMLCGRPPFAGDSVVRVLHAITAEQPPALGGSPAIVAADLVIHRALSKNPEDRYQTADAMAQELRATLLVADTGVAGARARPTTRLIVLPFRILRSDPRPTFSPSACPTPSPAPLGARLADRPIQHRRVAIRRRRPGSENDRRRSRRRHCVTGTLRAPASSFA